MGAAKTGVRTRTVEAGRSLLVDPGWLAVHLGDSDLRVVEVDVSPAAYDDWHIDGAVLWDVYRDLKDADYRLSEPAALEQLLARSGISPDSTVVFYGYAPAMGLWLMRLWGHHDTRILDCSRETWRAEGLPWSTEATQLPAGRYHFGDEDRSIRADRAAVQRAIGTPGTTLVDVRSEPEYRGERFWPSGGLAADGRAGHVPSAVHQPIDGLFDERGAFRATADLRRVFSSIDPGDNCEEFITYCTIGGRAATAWFVLTYLLGHERVRVYDGSWAEWGRIADTAVERC
jgi:thiosulfate/3-mercaptopyruvate sulfurtransferase